MKVKARRKFKSNDPRWIYAILALVVLFVIVPTVIYFLNKSPLAIEDLSYIMPDDKPGDYDVYRVISVKEDVTRQELVGLMQYFTKIYLEEDRVLIYIFNNRAGPHVGDSKSLVARFFKNKPNKQYSLDIYLDEPYMQEQ